MAVKVLLEHGANISHKFEGTSALQLAKKYGHKGVVGLIRAEIAKRKLDSANQVRLEARF